MCFFFFFFFSNLCHKNANNWRRSGYHHYRWQQINREFIKAKKGKTTKNIYNCCFYILFLYPVHSFIFFFSLFGFNVKQHKQFKKDSVLHGKQKFLLVTWNSTQSGTQQLNRNKMELKINSHTHCSKKFMNKKCVYFFFLEFIIKMAEKRTKIFFFPKNSMKTLFIFACDF